MGSEVSSVGGASDPPLQGEEESETIQGMKCRAPFEEVNRIFVVYHGPW